MYEPNTSISVSPHLIFEILRKEKRSMMKRIAALLMLLIICIGIFTGCGHKNKGESDASSEEASIQSSSAAAGSVEITIPKTADDICGSYISENSSRLGISTPTSKADGSVSFTINSNSKDELIRNLRIMLNEKLDTLKSSNSFITQISFDRDLTTLTCLTDSTSYKSPDESFFETCYTPLIACLAVEGKSEESIKDFRMKVVFIDKDNFSLISKYKYPSDSSEAPTVSSSDTQTADTTGDSYTDETYTDETYTDDSTDYYSDDYSDNGDYYSEEYYYTDEEYYN